MTSPSKLPFLAQAESELQPELATDRGACRVAADWREAFEALGWRDAESIMRWTGGDVLRDRDRRDVRRVVVPGRGSNADRTLYLKRHRCWERPVAPIGTQFPGIGEAQSVATCADLGIASIDVIAAGGRTTRDAKTGRVVCESFLVSEAIPAPSCAELIQRWRQEGTFDRADRRELRRRMIELAAETISRMHAAGAYHQDLYWHHLYFPADKRGELSARLIDVQRLAQPPRWRRWSFWWKDMEHMRFSMQRLAFPHDEIRYWYECYFGGGIARPLTAWQHIQTCLIRWRKPRRVLRKLWRQPRGGACRPHGVPLPPPAQESSAAARAA
ncbi:MAG: hypothetical protein KF774_11510 [Planctomyces sp.]|nr:hypothetical protein [Planctomyces sp.]